MRTLVIRTKGEHMQDAINWIMEKRDAFNPNYPIQYSILSEEIEVLYKEEKIIFSLFIFV